VTLSFMLAAFLAILSWNWEAHMRKQDRIARDQEQNRSEREPERKPESPRKEREEMVGGGSREQPAHPERQSGKLPLPD
jgi:hypothetical protein